MAIALFASIPIVRAFFRKEKVKEKKGSLLDMLEIDTQPDCKTSVIVWVWCESNPSFELFVQSNCIVWLYIYSTLKS